MSSPDFKQEIGPDLSKYLKKPQVPGTNRPRPLRDVISREAMIASAAILGVSALVSLTDQHPFNASADTKFLAKLTPTATPHAKGKMPSQQAFNEQVKILQGKEGLQTNSGNAEFKVDSDNYMWDVNNASGGINPPNDPDIGTGTVRVRKNGTWDASKDFQGLQRLAPQPLIAQAIGGIAVSIPWNSYYLAEVTLRSDGNYNPYFELGRDIKNPEKYIGRVTRWKGLPQGGLIGRYQPVTLGTDANGNYANITYLFADNINTTDCIIVTECGTYQIRLDNLGDFSGDTFTKLPDPTPSPTPTPKPKYYLYLPAVTDRYKGSWRKVPHWRRKLVRDLY